MGYEIVEIISFCFLSKHHMWWRFDDGKCSAFTYSTVFPHAYLFQTGSVGKGLNKLLGLFSLKRRNDLILLWSVPITFSFQYQLDFN